MKIGIVSQWFNRGQATVGRYLRDSFDKLGHETLVLARPAKDQFYLPGTVNFSDVWEQEQVQPASHYEIPQREYLDWASRHCLDLIWFDQNYQFDEIRALRQAGHRTIGRFVWEAFAQKHVAAAQAAFDCIYSLTDCEHARYLEMGIQPRRIPWGIHPELIHERQRDAHGPRFFYPGGFLSTRKPTGEVYEAFRAFRRKHPQAGLTIKSQRPLRRLDLQVPATWAEIRMARHDDEQTASDLDLEALAAEGVTVIEDDMPAANYRDLFAGYDVCVAPSRWEGLGLHLWEALGYGLPILCNDMPPLNEVVQDGENGLLTACQPIAHRPNGIPVMKPDIDAMTRALARMADPGFLEHLRQGVIRSRERFHWNHTLRGLESLIADYG